MGVLLVSPTTKKSAAETTWVLTWVCSQRVLRGRLCEPHQENSPQLIRATEATLGLTSENRGISLARKVPV